MGVATGNSSMRRAITSWYFFTCMYRQDWGQESISNKKMPLSKLSSPSSTSDTNSESLLSQVKQKRVCKRLFWWDPLTYSSRAWLNIVEIHCISSGSETELDEPHSSIKRVRSCHCYYYKNKLYLPLVLISRVSNHGRLNIIVLYICCTIVYM